MGYQVIEPPFTLKFDEMSKQELREYFDWFAAIIPERVRGLQEEVTNTSGFEKWTADCSPSSLADLGTWFSQRVSTRTREPREAVEVFTRAPSWFQAVEVSDRELTNETFSMAVDIGMYLAQVLLKGFPSLKWRLHTGSKKDIDYGQPVLADFGGLVLNPTRVAVTLAYGLAQGKVGGSRLREVYDYWSNRAKK